MIREDSNMPFDATFVRGNTTRHKLRHPTDDDNDNRKFHTEIARKSDGQGSRQDLTLKGEVEINIHQVYICSYTTPKEAAIRALTSKLGQFASSQRTQLSLVIGFFSLLLETKFVAQDEGVLHSYWTEVVLE
jgi:hypothetical protein